MRYRLHKGGKIAALIAYGQMIFGLPAIYNNLL